MSDSEETDSEETSEEVSRTMDPWLEVALTDFLSDMREKLLKNSHKVGWRTMNPAQILARVAGELAEVFQTCTPSAWTTTESSELRAHITHQREQMLIATHHLRCAATVLHQLSSCPKEIVLSPKTAWEAADVANFCMFLAVQSPLHPFQRRLKVP